MESGTTTHPGRQELVITAKPHQAGLVTWELICTENSGGVGSKMGQKTLQLPVVKVVKPPAPSSSCSVSASVQLSATGSVTIAIED
jgi:hypothetical protein